MPTYAPTTGNISFSQVKSAFPGVTKFSDLRSRYFYTAANAYGRNSSSTISLSQLRGRGDTANVSPGYAQYFNSGSIGPIGVVNSLTITIIAAGGGGFGGTGNTGVTGGQGTVGQNSSITGYGTALGGQPSSATANGADGSGAADNYPPGGKNVVNDFRGGTGGRVTFTYNKNTNFDALSALFGTSLNATIGAGGTGGGGGANFVLIGGVLYPAGNNAPSGGSGTNGLVQISWT